MKIIPLTRGQVAVVDDADYKKLSAYRWHVLTTTRKHTTLYYAVRKKRHGRKVTTIYMHREVLGISNPAIQVDHKNGNTLDNRRAELRVATPSQNLQNQQKSPGLTSKFKGVCWVTAANKWKAQIQVNRQKHNLGFFDTEEDAATSYANAAIRLFGAFACLQNRAL